MFYLRQNGAQPPLSLRDLQISEPCVTLLCPTRNENLQGGKRPKSAIVKHTITNPVNTEGIDEKSRLHSIQ